MSILSNVSGKKTADSSFVPWPYLDTLYDYKAFLEQGNICTIPNTQYGQEIAIIGAGAAGLVAAYELLKCGFNPVIFEASDRIGGRAYSKPFTDEHGHSVPAFAEMGSMRVPVSNETFYYYVDQFGLQIAPDFPDPGHVPTHLYYENTGYDWAQGASPPGPFTDISKKWGAFIQPLIDEIHTPWQAGDLEQVKLVWQSYITKYKDKTFYEVVKNESDLNTAEELNAFGALGVGSGGFGPLYEVNFLELLRIIINGWETDQKQILSGMSAIPNGFYNTLVTRPDGSQVSLAGMGAVNFNCRVMNIDTSGSNPILTVETPYGTNQYKYPAVIVATTTRAMQFMGLTMPTDGKLNVSEKVAESLRNLHMMNSSKMFIRTATKFWENTDLPQNIQTDELPRGIYTLDYGKQTDNGIVLISYTWGDDSIKLQSMPTMERFKYLRSIIAQISPDFAAQLNPVNDQVYNIDWQSEMGYYGAFKLNYPGQEPDMHAAYYQFLSVLDAYADEDTGVYLAGDGVSWSGGWTEGALHTGINAACAAAYRVGASFSGEMTSPLSQDPNMYDYGQND